ncbi:MAG: hypothetical protein WBE37_04180 [Bryobacteraceae bacterium]
MMILKADVKTTRSVRAGGFVGRNWNSRSFELFSTTVHQILHIQLRDAQGLAGSL